MFENIIGQPAAELLAVDIAQGRLAPAMLFSGPAASGKGTAALELARIISCENPGKKAPWNCACPACARHRFLLHQDLLCLGSRPFSAEIAAAASTFLREPSLAAGEILFIRSVRKLLARFNPVLWEEEPKFSRLSPFIVSLEEGLDELDAAGNQAAGGERIKKAAENIVKESFRLEAEGIEKTIPIARIRRAAWWSRLAPVGKGKLLLIENADRMQEGARNSLLKILEEPPPAVSIILTTCHEQALLPTILSRVRPYRFVQRTPEVEAEVIRRVFGADAQDEKNAAPSIAAYLKTFLPVTDDALRPLAAYLAASVAMTTALRLRRPASDLPWELVALGKYAAPIAEAAGLGRPVKNMQVLIEKLLASTGAFEMRGLFSGFLQTLLALVGESLAEPPDAERGGRGGFSPAYLDIWRICAAEAAASIHYNQRPAATLNRLTIEARRAMTALWRV